MSDTGTGISYYLRGLAVWPALHISKRGYGMWMYTKIVYYIMLQKTVITLLYQED